KIPSQTVGRFGDQTTVLHHADLIEVEEYSLGDLNEPANYKAVILDSESDKWVDAMNAKMQSMKDNQVWCLVDLPPNYMIRLRLNGGAVDWKSSKQSTTAMSTTEAKYIAASKAMMEAVWIRKFILGLDTIRLRLNGGAVDWKSSKQSTAAMSTTEAKYIAASEAMMEAVWIRKFILGLGTVAVKETGLWCLRIPTTNLSIVFVMFESKLTRWFFFLMMSLLARGTSCSSEIIVACGFALDMLDSENKIHS
nr:retrotransposon protein, putative, Ty1-copia subclass [Tanacetum cinerariifolium]